MEKEFVQPTKSTRTHNFINCVFQIRNQPKMLMILSCKDSREIQISELWLNTSSRLRKSGKRCFTCASHQYWSPLSTFSFSNGLPNHYFTFPCFLSSHVLSFSEPGLGWREKNFPNMQEKIQTVKIFLTRISEMQLLVLQSLGLLPVFISSSCVAAGKIFL